MCSMNGLRVLLCVFVFVVGVRGACESRVNINNNNPDPHTSYGEPSEEALVLWVTSGVFLGGEFGSVSGLDAMCTRDQPTNTIGTFTHTNQARVAFISTSTQDAVQRFPQNIDIINTKGKCLGSNAADALGSVLTYLLLDETGQPLNGQTEGIPFVYTGTTDAGLRAGGTDPAKYCNDWSSSSSSVVASESGEIPLDPNTAGSNALWIQSSINDKCNNTYHFYCISAAAAPTSGGQGDPQFVGLQGQSFQVHGIPDEYFNLLSHPFTQLNSHFTYLATGTCHYNDTLCWSHPGTYVDELGVMLPGVQIAVRAGTHSQGLTVHVNGKQMHLPKALRTQPFQPQATGRAGTGTATLGTAFTATFPIQLDNDTLSSRYNAWLEPDPEANTDTDTDMDSDSDSDEDSSSSSSVPWYSWLSSASCRVSFYSHNRVVITTPVATIDIYNAEHFFNFQLEFRAPRLLLAGAPLHRVLQSGGSAPGAQQQHQHQANSNSATQRSPHPHFPMHGLVGQTWKNVRYPHGRLYAGQVDDYMLTDRQLFSTQFHFNEYLY